MKKVFTFLGLYGLLMAGIFALASCSSAPKSSEVEFDCVTPVGNITITEQTDTNISFDGKTVEATRETNNGPVIAQIPFSQCIRLRKK